jgi:predicted extracellular nuclease
MHLFAVARVRLRLFAGVVLAGVIATFVVQSAGATSVPQSLPFSQNWSDTGLVTVSDDWSDVPGVVGFRGDGLASTGADPQTVLEEGSPPVIDVNANEASPNTFFTGGVAEFHLPDPTVALQGSGTADAPSVVLYVNATGTENVTVSYNLRDIDGSADNAVQQVALQYRVGLGGNYVNVPAGYVADATTGPSLATLVTPVSVTLPAAVSNQPRVEVRIITADAAGSDEWVGVDDISVTGSAIANAPVVANCGSGLVTQQGAAATRQVSASDADGRVTSLAIASVTPSPTSGSITIANVVPASANGGTATADVTVDANVPVGSYSVQVTATNADATPQSGSCTLTVTVEPPDVPIYELQGAGRASPFAGTQQSTTGVVTVILSSGFFIQDPTGDGNPATSDGIFVFTSQSAARTQSPGDLVRVRGRVVDFRPSSRPRDLTLTEFSPTTSVTKLGTAALPTPVPISNRPDVAIEPDGIDSFEALEGMLVSIDTPRVSGPTNSFGEFVVAASGDQANMSAGGNFLLRPLPGDAVDYNPERIMVDDEARVPGGTGAGVRINNPMVPLTVGDRANGDVVGALDYQFSNFRVQANHLVSAVLPGSAAPTTPVANLRDAHPWEGRVSSFNVENLFDCLDAPGKDDTHPTCNANDLAALDTQVAKLADGFERELERPEIVVVEETENTGVLTGDASGNIPGTTGSSRPVQALLPRLSGNWDAISFDASDERGIEVAFVWNTDRVALHDAFLATDPVKGIPDGGIFSGSATIRPGREPLVGHFTLDDVDLTIVGNHLKSKGGPQFGVDPLEAGDDPLYGAFQPPVRWTEVQLRHRQADYVRDLVDLLLAAEPGSRILVAGDLNDFEFGEPGEGQHTVARISDSPTAPLTNVIPLIPQAERYTFLFEGNSQVLDHMLLNAPLAALRRDQAIAHFNADYPDAFGANPATTVRSSDHDPLVTYFCTDLTAPTLSVSVAPNVLWPPDHKYRTVRATVSAADNADPSPAVELVSVTSNEPDDGTGDGDTANDIVVVDAKTFMLRSEHAGSGDGRIYTITYRATDACGNTVTKTATVTVPHDRRK